VNVYVAGPSSEVRRCIAQIGRILDTRGLSVTYDWTAAVTRYLAGDRFSRDELITYAQLDLAGVLNADLVWGLLPSKGHASAGLWVEIGAALADADRMVLLSGVRSNCIFEHLADKYFPDDDAAFRWIKRQGGLEGL